MSVGLQEVPPPLVTVAEVANELRVSTSAVYGWIQKGAIDRSALIRVGAGKRRGVRIHSWWLAAVIRNGEMPKIRTIGGRRA